MYLEYPLISLLPAALIALAGALARARWPEERLPRRWLLCSFVLYALLIGAVMVLQKWEAHRVIALVQPSLVAVGVALAVHLAASPSLWRRPAIWLTLPLAAGGAALEITLWTAVDPLAALAPAIIALIWLLGEPGRVRRWISIVGLLFMGIAAAGESPAQGTFCAQELARARADAPP